jgi:DNA-binding response OmpR family regulator
MSESRRRILCIEDDRDAASLIREELIDRGFDVDAAYNGRDGLTAILTKPPDLVLSDISMPGMSGFQLLERLTAMAPRFDSMPFVFLTALGDHDNELKGWHLGADDYLTKPVDYDVLAALISARLARVARSVMWPRQVDLREREVETLTWAARGKTFEEIGTILSLSKRTVEFHLENARRKLGVATRTQALIKAAAGNLIQPCDGRPAAPGCSASSTGRKRLRDADAGERTRRKQHLDVGRTVRDIDTVAPDALRHADDDVLLPVEIPVKGPSRVAAGGLNGRLDDGTGRARPDDSDDFTVRPPQILQFESLAAPFSEIGWKSGYRQPRVFR